MCYKAQEIQNKRDTKKKSRFRHKVKFILWKLSNIYSDSHYFHCNPFKPCSFCREFLGGYSTLDKAIFVLRHIVRTIMGKPV